QAADRRGDAAERAGDERNGVGRRTPVVGDGSKQVPGGAGADRQKADEERKKSAARARHAPEVEQYAPHAACQRLAARRGRRLGNQGERSTAKERDDRQRRGRQPWLAKVLREPQACAAAEPLSA